MRVVDKLINRPFFILHKKFTLIIQLEVQGGIYNVSIRQEARGVHYDW